MKFALNLPLFYHPLVRRACRLGRAAIVGLAALYAVLAAVHAATYVGANAGVFGFAAQTLRADAYDMLSTIRGMVLGDGMGIGYRPVRYAIICQSFRGNSATYETENAVNERRVRLQIGSKSGAVYNNLRTVLADPGAQPVLFLSNSDGGAKVCGARAYWLQNCTCDGNSTTVERGRILAKDLFN